MGAGLWFVLWGHSGCAIEFRAQVDQAFRAAHTGDGTDTIQHMIERCGRFGADREDHVEPAACCMAGFNFRQGLYAADHGGIGARFDLQKCCCPDAPDLRSFAQPDGVAGDDAGGFEPLYAGLHGGARNTEAARQLRGGGRTVGSKGREYFSIKRILHIHIITVKITKNNG